MARKLQVEIIGDASSLQRALGQASKSGSTFGSTLKTLGKTAAIAGGAAGFGALFVTLKQGFAEVSESQKVMAQTGAVLKSTGQAANVSAREVTNYAESLSAMSGVDDEAIQSGENMLLTFTNIHNEVGKGNDIFKQSTATLLDMSTALGTDMNKSAIQLGKALNDPIKGIGALSRVGVTFTAQQKDQIKAMVASGDTMGAQKVILKELNKEFGGSAAAAGKTLPGQLNKLKNAFDEAAGAIVQKLLPYLNRFLAFINENMPAIQSAMDTAIGAIATSIDAVVGAVDKIKGPLKTMADAAKAIVDFFRESSGPADVLAGAIIGLTAAVVAYVAITRTVAIVTEAWAAAQIILNAAMATNPFILIAAALVGLGIALVVAYKKSETFRNIVNGAFEAVKGVVMPIINTLKQLWDRFGDDIISVARTAFGLLKQVIMLPMQNVLSAVKALVAIFQGDWQEAWDAIKEIPLRILRVGAALIRTLGPLFLKAASALGNAIKDGVLEGIGAIRSWLGAKLSEIGGAISGVAGRAYGWALEVGKRLVQGVLDGLSGLAGAVKEKAEGMLRGALSSLSPFSSVETGGQKYIGEPIIKGAIAGLEAMSSQFTSKTSKVTRDAVMAADKAVKEGRTEYRKSWNDYVGEALGAFDEVAGKLLTKSEKLIADLAAKQQQQAPKVELTEATAALDTAKVNVAWNQVMLPEETVDQWLERVKTANDELAAAQARYDAAKLAVQAQTERAALNQRITADRTNFQQWLASRTLEQQQALIQEGKGQEAIVTKIKSYGPDYRAAGKKLGDAIATGLRDAAGGVVDAANELADAIRKALGVASQTGKTAADNAGERTRVAGGRAAGGGVQSGRAYVVGERGPELFRPGTSGMVIPNGGWGGGATVVNNYISGSVVTERQLADTVRTELMRIGRYNAGGVFGGVA